MAATPDRRSFRSHWQRGILYQSILYRDDTDYQMPPKGKLTASVVEDFRRWILMGAPDPRVTKINPAVKTEIDIEKGREFWAYRPPVKTTPPKSKNSTWARTTIDEFVIAKLDEKGLSPVKDAEARTLVRRLFFVLTGLPPTPDEITKWTAKIEAASSEAARQGIVSSLVTSLLDSPRYGERWGRHWMDVARFAESTGRRSEQHLSARLAVPRLHHRFDERRQAVRSVHSRTDCRRPFANRERPGMGGQPSIATGFLAVGAKLVGEEDSRSFSPTWSTNRSIRPLEPFWPRPSPAPAATTTSSTRSRSRTTTLWRESFETRRLTTAY